MRHRLSAALLATVLTLSLTLPAAAAGRQDRLDFGWFQSWVLGWFTGWSEAAPWAAGVRLDPSGATVPASEAGMGLDPSGLEAATSEAGASLDPSGGNPPPPPGQSATASAEPDPDH